MIQFAARDTIRRVGFKPTIPARDEASASKQQGVDMILPDKVGRALVLFTFIPCASLAEIVTTEDGRSIHLKPDGTYEFVETDAAPLIALTEQQPFFEHHSDDYGRSSMRFMPVVRNETGRTVIGFRFQTTFRSAFGDEVFTFEGESSERVAPDAWSTWRAYYFFEDNQFINDQPYDKLKIFQASGTGSIETLITAVVFENGEIVKAE